jgi:hypothetical protein
LKNLKKIYLPLKGKWNKQRIIKAVFGQETGGVVNKLSAPG